MPIYEYRCNGCGKVSSFLTRSVSETLEPTCTYCGGRGLTKTVTSFVQHRSVKDVQGSYGPPPAEPSLDYYKDPRNIGRRAEETFEKFGVDMPASVRESIDAARSGEIPKELEV